MTVSNAISSRKAPPGARPGNGASSFSTGDRFALGGPSPALDPRIHAYRSGLADIALAGRVFAPRYAKPLIRACGMSGTPVRPTAEPDAEPVSELLPGEEFAILEYAAGRAWGYCVADDCVGYVEAIALAEPAAPTHIVCEASAPIHPEGGLASPILARLPMGSRLHGDERGPCLATEFGCVPLCHLRRIGEVDGDPAEVAERLLGVAYRPGGRSFHGLDCAGLVQLAFGLCGLSLPRHADQQQSLGDAVPHGEPPLRGDLLFAGEHVAIALGGDRVIHLGRTNRTVTIEPLAAVQAPSSAAPPLRRRIGPFGV